MNIQQNTVVTVDYRLNDGSGEHLDDSRTSGPMVYLHGYRHILPALESALEGAATGDERVVELQPEHAYGPRQENLVFEASREVLPAGLELYEGQRLTSGSHGRRFTLRVVRLTANGAVLDGNHPLVGRRLIFRLNVSEVRPATMEEVRERRASGDTTRARQAPF